MAICWRLFENRTIVKKLLVISTLGVTIALGVDPDLMADNAGAYAGVGLGHTMASVAELTQQDLPVYDLFSVLSPIYSSGTSTANNNIWMLYGGYQFNNPLAVEVQYSPLGEFTRNAEGAGILVQGRAGTKFTTLESLKLSGFGLAAKVQIPVKGRFSVYGKLGEFSWQAKLTSTTAFVKVPPIDSVTTTSKDNGFSPYYSFGGSYKFDNDVSLRGEWTQITKVGGGLPTGETNVTAILISSQINF
jgi:hypothetical protein